MGKETWHCCKRHPHYNIAANVTRTALLPHSKCRPPPPPSHGNFMCVCVCVCGNIRTLKMHTSFGIFITFYPTNHQTAPLNTAPSLMETDNYRKSAGRFNRKHFNFTWKEPNIECAKCSQSTSLFPPCNRWFTLSILCCSWTKFIGCLRCNKDGSKIWEIKKSELASFFFFLFFYWITSQKVKTLKEKKSANQVSPWWWLKM